MPPSAPASMGQALPRPWAMPCTPAPAMHPTPLARTPAVTDRLLSCWPGSEPHEAEPKAEGERESDPAAHGGRSHVSGEITKDAPLQPPPRHGAGSASGPERRAASCPLQESRGSTAEKLFATPWRGRVGTCLNAALGAAHHQCRASAALQPSPARH